MATPNSGDRKWTTSRMLTTAKVRTMAAVASPRALSRLESFCGGLHDGTDAEGDGGEQEA